MLGSNTSMTDVMIENIFNPVFFSPISSLERATQKWKIEPLYYLRENDFQCECVND